jgi:hypothetical protein
VSAELLSFGLVEEVVEVIQQVVPTAFTAVHGSLQRRAPRQGRNATEGVPYRITG